MKNTSLEFESIENPQDLPVSTIEEIRFVSQDIWSRMDSLGELCQCPQCKTIYAAEDIFSEEQLKEKLVGELIRENFGDENIPCKNPSCEGIGTRMLFGGKHIEDIRARYTDSVKSFLVLCREKTTGNIVGFEDGYIGTVYDATKREFQHYNPEDPESINSSSDKWIHHVEQEVARILGYTSKNVLTLASIGVLSQYKNPFIFFELLKAFTSQLPNEGEEYFSLPGITEIDKRNVLYRMSLAGGAQPLTVRGNPKRMNPNYEGTLLTSTHLIDTYKGFCTAGPRAFLKLLKS